MSKNSEASKPKPTPDPRRSFLKQVIGSATALPFAQGLAAGGAAAALVPAAAAAPAAAPAPVVNQVYGYVCFSAAEAGFVEALLNLMCPADEFTPNGVDCGLAIYMDRQLAGDFGNGVKRYMRGPWGRGTPQHGLQLPLTPVQFFKAGVEAADAVCLRHYGKRFDELSPVDANVFLNELSDGRVKDAGLPLDSWFNDIIYPLFQQACFADPVYGGNVDKVFWRMIGYPGLPATNTINMVQYRGKPVPGAKDPKSIADFS